MFRTNHSTPARRWVIGTLVAACLAFTAGFGFAKLRQPTALAVPFASAAPSEVTNVDLMEFWNLWRILKTRFYKQPVDDKKLLYGAMAGMAASLGDPYTSFFEPKQAEEFNKSLQGKFEGIGAEIGLKDDQLQIIAPLAEMPAEKAGLLPGDAILKIDGQEAAGMSVEKAVTLIRGEKGTVVTLTIGRIVKEKVKQGKEKKNLKIFDVKITRGMILVKSVRVSSLRDGITLITVTHFNMDTTELFRDSVAHILQKMPKGIILDLRSNPGGYLDRATAVAGEWVGEQLVVQEREQGKTTEQFHGTGSARLRGIPTIVLVNQGSASASEIVAGALQDYAIAKLVGMKTFGKGSVQDYIELGDKSSVKITIAEWLTPHGRLIDKIGIDPDIKVDRTEEDFHANRDPQLDKALEILTGKPTPTPLPKNKKK